MTQKTWIFSYLLTLPFDSKNWTLFISLKDFLWLRRQELNLFFLKMTQKMWTLFWTFFLYDSKIWTFFFLKIWFKELNMTQWIEPFFPVWLKELNPFKKWLKELSPFFNMIQRIELSFRNMSFFFKKIWLKELFFWKKTWLTELNLFLTWLIENWTLLFNMTQRIEPFFQYESKNWIWLKGLNFFFVSIWLKELSPFLDDSNWTLFSFSMWLKEWNPFLFRCDSKNWTLFLSMWLKELNLFFVWPQELKLFFQCDSKKKIEPLLLIPLTELNTFVKYDPKNWTFFWMWLKELNLFLNVTQIIELFFECTQRINLVSMTQWIEPFFFEKENETQRIEPFSIWLKDWFFFNVTQRIEYDSKNWTLSSCKFLFFLKKKLNNWSFF